MPKSFLTATAVLAISAPAYADENSTTLDVTDNTVEDVVRVHGRGLTLIGETSAASEGVVGYADFEDRPLSRVGELVEVIPGVVATQHSGEGKANQYFLRGFNLDHGTDFSVSVDGVPVNLRTHGHGQGYLDLNFVIPELVERVDFRKGPYRASNGDFSAAGSARYTTYDRLENGFAEVSAGEFGYLRGVVATGINVAADTDLILAVEAESHDGPWDLDQDLQKFNGFAKLVREAGSWAFEVIASAYDSEWTATDQIPERAVESGLIDRFGYIDPDLGGEVSRFSLSGDASYAHEGGAETVFSAYAVDYDFALYSNFTYLAGDPVGGDEFEQLDQRRYYGGSVIHSRPLGERTRLRLGAEARYDDISDIGLFQTAARERLSTVRRDSVEETSLSAWAEAEVSLTDRLRMMVGLRGDYYDADIDAVSAPVNGGSADDTLVSPSAGLFWRVMDSLEFYANYGKGFHSNDVRGATISVDPVSGDPVGTVPILVEAEGAEIGARFERGAFRGSVAVFSLDLDSELVFVGDAGTTEPNDATTRTGIEATAFWQPVSWLTADISAAYTDAELDISGSDTEIPNAVESVIGGGVLITQDPWTFSARLRHFGEAPLIEDGSVTSDPTTIVNLAATYEWRNVDFGVEVLNVFDAEDSDITYFFESQLPGEAAPVEDIHFHPVEPRQLRVSMRYNF